MRYVLLGLLALAVVLGGSLCAARADVLVTTRAGLGGTDSIDWGQLGAATPGSAGVPNPSNVTSAGGVNFTVSEQAGDFSRLDQGGAPGNGPWYGNFNPGDHLLYSGTAYSGGSGPIVIMGNTPLTAMGAQMMSDFYNGFTGQIQTLDALGNVISTFTEAGNANGNSDNSAIFIGVIASSPFYGIALDNIDNNAGDFAMNEVSFALGQQPVVPEPASLTLLSLGLLGAAGYGWRRKRRS
jgi:hypothetical protein